MFQVNVILHKCQSLVKSALSIHSGRVRYAPMEGLRAYAAMLVFVVHFLSNYSVKRNGVDLGLFSVNSILNVEDAFIWYFFRSQYGVDIFFFLSGFLVFRMAARSGFSYPRFIVNRFLRIYPAFFTTLIAIVALQVNDNRFVFDWARFLGNLFFLNGFPEADVKPYSIVTWSLGFEFSFYFILPLLLLSIGGVRHASPFRMMFLGFSAWIVLSFFNPHYIRFLMFFGGGFMAAFTDDSLRYQAENLSDWSAVLIYTVCGIVFSLTDDLRVFIPMFLVGTYVVVLRSMYGNGWLFGLFSAMPMRVFGNLSYSFYLVHGVVTSWIIWKVGFLFNWQLRIPVIGESAYFITTFVTSILVSLAVAGVVFFLAERPYFSRDRVEDNAKALKEPTA